MAEGMLWKFGADCFRAFSAGTNPKPVHPNAIKAMKEIGIDISAQVSKSIDRFLNDRFDVVITVCDRANERCPVFPCDVKRIHWSFDDPAEAVGTEQERMRVFRRVRNEIKERINVYLSEEKGQSRTQVQIDNYCC